MAKKSIPIDFLSWHTYSKNVADFTKREQEVRNALDTFGYTNTASILNEWNYLVAWEKPDETRENIFSASGASLTSAVISVMQNSSLDMLMYYTVQPGSRNGLFKHFTLKKLKSYYVFLMFSRLYKLQTQVEATSNDEDIYVISASDSKSTNAMITYYTCDDTATKKTVTVNIADSKCFKAYILDGENDMTYIGTVCEKADLVLEPNSVLFLSAEE